MCHNIRLGGFSNAVIYGGICRDQDDYVSDDLNRERIIDHCIQLDVLELNFDRLKKARYHQEPN